MNQRILEHARRLYGVIIRLRQKHPKGEPSDSAITQAIKEARLAPEEQDIVLQYLVAASELAKRIVGSGTIDTGSIEYRLDTAVGSFCTCWVPWPPDVMRELDKDTLRSILFMIIEDIVYPTQPPVTDVTTYPPPKESLARI